MTLFETRRLASGSLAYVDCNGRVFMIVKKNGDQKVKDVYREKLSSASTSKRVRYRG